MVRAAGALLICLAGIGMGRSVTKQLKLQHATVRAFREALFGMQQRITFYKTPLPQMLQEIADASAGQVSVFFSEAAARLQKNRDRTAEAVLKQCFHDMSGLSLPLDAVHSFERLISCLGWMDGANQNEAICRAVTEFTELEDRMRTDLDRRGRCYLTLGACCGIAAAIIVI